MLHKSSICNTQNVIICDATEVGDEEEDIDDRQVSKCNNHNHAQSTEIPIKGITKVHTDENSTNEDEPKKFKCVIGIKMWF